jgi:hypothetical protein
MFTSRFFHGAFFKDNILKPQIYPEISAERRRAKMRLTKEEKELMESLEKDKWKTIPNLKEEIKRSMPKTYARSTIAKVIVNKVL